MAAAGASAQVGPLHEVFWERPPAPGPYTALLWQFDGEAGADEERLLAELTGPAEAPAGGRQELLGGTEKIAARLGGDAAPAAEGKFGGSLRLKGRGWAAPASPLPAKRVATEGALCFEMWLRPDPKAAGEQTLLHLPGAAREAVRLRWAPDGALSLWAGERRVGGHDRPAPAGTWTHAALVLSPAGTAGLYVNGTRRTLQPEPDAALAAAVRGAAQTFAVGGDPDGPGGGFIGHLDAVHVRLRDPGFYEWQDQDWLDPAARRTPANGPPYFRRAGGLTLRCSFDGTLTPEVFAGVAALGQAEEEHFAPGVRGQALDLSRVDKTGLALAGLAVLPEKAGSLEFWLRPKDWNNFLVGDYRGTNVPRLRLIRLATERTPPYLGRWTLVVLQGRAGQDALGRDYVPMHPGRWTHVVVTWGPKGRCVYLDGRPQDVGQVIAYASQQPADAQEYEAWQRRTGGKDDGAYRLTFPPSATLIDELRVYTWALDEREARNAYARYFLDAAEALTPLPPVEAVYQYLGHSWSMQPRLRVRLAALPVEGETPAAASLRLADPAGRTIHEQDRVALDESGEAALEVPGALGFGTFPVELASLAADGRVLHATKTTYERPQPPWWENDLGKDRSVPPPWTPVRVEGDELRVWGRTVRLAGTGLPAQVQAAGRDVLAAAARIVARAGGQDRPLAGAGVSWTEKADDRAAWTARLSGAGLAGELSAWMEYDGLAYCTVTLRPAAAAPARVERLVVEFPLRRQEATQLICNGGGHNFRASYDVRMIPDGNGTVWDSRNAKPAMLKAVNRGSWCPAIWVGGDRCGISFCGENDKGWTIDDEAPAQEIARDGDAVVFRMNVIPRPETIEGERAFHFILVPTPTKPLPAEWRGWNRSRPGVPCAKYDVIDQFIGTTLTDAHGRPTTGIGFRLEPHSWEDAALQARDLRTKWGAANPVLFYIDASWPRLGPTMADWSADLWAGTGRIAWTRQVEDYMVWIVGEYIRRGLIDGLYIDDVSMCPTNSLAAGAYDLPGAEPARRVGFSSMGLRRFCQRVWKLFVATGKYPHIVAHMTWCFDLPALSFAAAAVNGEDRDVRPFARHDTMDAWSRDELRIMGNAPKWGFCTFWKPSVYGETNQPALLPEWLYWQSRTMHAQVMPHDMWYLWTYPTANVILPSLLEFGMDDPEMRFLPYWALDGAAAASAEGDEPVLLGLFVKPDRALVMVSNPAREDRAATVTVDAEKLFGRRGEVSWRDADCSLKPPASRVILPTGEAEPKTKDIDALTGGTGEEEDLELEERDPQAEWRQRMEVRAEGPQARLLVRKRDYRLLEVRLK